MKKPKLIDPVEPVLRSNILAVAAAYAKHRDLKLSTLSTYCHGDAPFLQKMKDGGGLTARKYDEVMAWFLENWPDDLAWPATVVILSSPGKVRRRGINAAKQHAGSPA